MTVPFVLLSLSLAPPHPVRNAAPHNWFQGMDLIKAARAAREQKPYVCAIPLLRVPVDPNIDPKIALRIPRERKFDRMPEYRGLPVCPAER